MYRLHPHSGAKEPRGTRGSEMNADPKDWLRSSTGTGIWYLRNDAERKSRSKKDKKHSKLTSV